MTSTLSDTSPTDGAMTRGSVVREVARVCAGWGVNEIHGWSMAERRGVLADVDRLIAVLGMARARILSVEEASGDWALSGAKDVASWRAQSTRAGFGAAKGDLELATAVVELPRLGDAVTDGSITLEHAKAVAREFGGASDAQKQVLLHDRDVQDRVFKNAERSDAGKFGRSMKLTMAEIDPDKFQRDHDAVHERRFARVRHQAGGVYLEAFLNTFDGRKLSEALRATAHRPVSMMTGPEISGARTPWSRWPTPSSPTAAAAQPRSLPLRQRKCCRALKFPLPPRPPFPNRPCLGRTGRS